MRLSSRSLLIVAGLTAVACQNNNSAPSSALPPPQSLTYALDPSGDPNNPAGILLSWQDVQSSDLQSYRIYSRASTAGAFGLRGETTSNTFHDNGVPHLQYFVTAVDLAGAESDPSNTVTVNEYLLIGAPSTLTGITLDSAIHLDWQDTPDLARFKWYRVYSSDYVGGSNPCPTWVLEGTTVSHEFLAAQLPNGVTRCFDVSAVDTLGYESLWALASPGWTDTPRPDARNVLVWGFGGAHNAQAGFRFWDDVNQNGYGDAGELGLVEDGTRTDIDFVLHVHADSTLWIVPVFSGTQLQLYSASPIADLTSIDLAPATGYTRDSLQAQPGFGYVFAILDGTVLHYGALRMTHVGRQYAIFDWSVQTDPSNPDLAPPKRAAMAAVASK
jgi:fibronectin type 3 domain-containing protein